MNQDQEPFSAPLPITAHVSRRGLLPRLVALPAALGLTALVTPESAEARKKRRKRRRRRRDKNTPGDGSSDGGNDTGGSNTGDGDTGGGSSPEDQERAFLTLINTYRENTGRNPLRRHNQLDAAAERHSQDMATNGFFDHRGSDGSRADDRIGDAGYDWSAWGENIFWHSSDGSADTAFAAWKKSPDHNANMLSRSFTEIGIARVQSRRTGRWYWTTTFGRR